MNIFIDVHEANALMLFGIWLLDTYLSWYEIHGLMILSYLVDCLCII